MEPQPGFAVHEVGDVGEELECRFAHVMRPVQHQADLGQGQHRHHEGVVPHLVVILLGERDVLHAAVRGARHLAHRPLGPGVEPRHHGAVAGLFVSAGQGEERGHRVDVLRGALGLPRGEPGVDDVPHRLVTGLVVVLPDPVQTDAVGPFPPRPALGVDDPTVVQAEQELAGGVLDRDQVGGQAPDELPDFSPSRRTVPGPEATGCASPATPSVLLSCQQASIFLDLVGGEDYSQLIPAGRRLVRLAHPRSAFEAIRWSFAAPSGAVDSGARPRSAGPVRPGSSSAPGRPGDLRRGVGR